MRYFRFVAALGCALMTASAVHAEPPSVSPALRAELKKVIVGNCASVQCAKADALNIRVDKLSDDYAKVIVSRTDGKGKPEVAYLRKKEDGWVLLDKGADVNPADLGLPKEVW